MNLAVLILLVGCGDRDTSVDDTGPEACDPSDTADSGLQVGVIGGECRCEDAAITIGEGGEQYVPPVEGACLQMVHGPQGGWHLPAALLASNTRNVISIVAWAETGGVRMTDELTYRVQLVPEDTCEGSFPNMYLYLTTKHSSPEDNPAELFSCQEVVITMCIDDTGGNAVCGERTVVVAPDPRDVEKGMVPACEACP